MQGVPGNSIHKTRMDSFVLKEAPQEASGHAQIFPGVQDELNQKLGYCKTEDLLHLRISVLACSPECFRTDMKQFAQYVVLFI